MLFYLEVCVLSSILNMVKGWESWKRFLQLSHMILRFVKELFQWSYDICKFAKTVKDHAISWRHDCGKRIYFVFRIFISNFNLPKSLMQEGDVPWFRFVIELKKILNWGFWSVKILNSWLRKLNSELRCSKSPHDQFVIALGKGVVLMRSWSGEFLCVDVNVLYLFV